MQTGLVVFLALRTRRRLAQRRAQRKRGQYTKLPPIDDSGVVLNNESAITMRTVADDSEDEDGDFGHAQTEGGSSSIAAHKAVVGPDELLPGETEPQPKEAEVLAGSRTLLMWLPAIFDVRRALSSPSRQ